MNAAASWQQRGQCRQQGIVTQGDFGRRLAHEFDDPGCEGLGAGRRALGIRLDGVHDVRFRTILPCVTGNGEAE
jgi:hypothetical protein